MVSVLLSLLELNVVRWCPAVRDQNQVSRRYAVMDALDAWMSTLDLHPVPLDVPLLAGYELPAKRLISGHQ
jgi:hypothetical protein